MLLIKIYCHQKYHPLPHQAPHDLNDDNIQKSKNLLGVKQIIMMKTSERCDVTTMHRVEGVTKAKIIELCNVHPKSRVPHKRTKNTNLHLLTSNPVTIAFFSKLWREVKFHEWQLSQEKRL